MFVRLAVALVLLACLCPAHAPAAPTLWHTAQPQAAAPLCDLFANGFDVPTTQVCASCFDGVADNLEPDIDCGGPYCAACADGKQCGQPADCQSGVCAGGLCQAPTCSDGVKNGQETDADCGGPLCAKCGDAKQCNTGVDCTSGVCDPATFTCQAPTCSDGVKNGQESDVDCGGPSCLPCGEGRQCGMDSDCAAGLCDPITHTCQAPSCTDGKKNGMETDVDCGGPLCPKCAIGRQCLIGSDCLTGVCIGGFCQ